MALQQLIFGVFILALGVVALKIKPRVFKLYDRVFDTLSPDKPMTGLRNFQKIGGSIFVLVLLIGGVFFIFLSAYTVLQSQ